MFDLPSFKLSQASSCPACNAPNDGATAIDGTAGPEPGDLSICVYCRTFLRYDDELALLELTEDEIAELPDENRIQLQALRRFLRDNPIPSHRVTA